MNDTSIFGFGPVVDVLFIITYVIVMAAGVVVAVSILTEEW